MFTCGEFFFVPERTMLSNNFLRHGNQQDPLLSASFRTLGDQKCLVKESQLQQRSPTIASAEWFNYKQHHNSRISPPFLVVLEGKPTLKTWETTFRESGAWKRNISCTQIWNCLVNAYTLPESNMFAPENGWLEDDFLFGMAYFQVRKR